MVNLLHTSKKSRNSQVLHFLTNLALFLNKTMVSKYSLTMFAFLFIHGFCWCKLLVQLRLECFISGPIGVHYLTLKIFTCQLNNLNNTKIGKKRACYFSSDKISFRVNHGSIPKLSTSYELCSETKFKVVFAMLNMCSFPKKFQFIANYFSGRKV